MMTLLSLRIALLCCCFFCLSAAEPEFQSSAINSLEFSVFKELFQPNRRFQNGEYFGETICKEADKADKAGCSGGGGTTPHGSGSYRRASDGRILYDGQWYNGKHATSPEPDIGRSG